MILRSPYSRFDRQYSLVENFMYSLHFSLTLSIYRKQIGSNTNALAKFCHSRSVAAYSHFPFFPSSRYYRHTRSTRKKITRCRTEYEGGDAIQVSNNRTSTFRSAKPIGPIAPFLSCRDYRTTRCIVDHQSSSRHSGRAPVLT